MKLYQLLWKLVIHALHGRFRDEVFVSVVMDNDQRTLGLTGSITGLTWESDADAFCIIEAFSTDPAPYTEHPPFVGDCWS